MRKRRDPGEGQSKREIEIDGDKENVARMTRDSPGSGVAEPLINNELIGLFEFDPATS